MGIWANILLNVAVASIVHETGHLLVLLRYKIKLKRFQLFSGRPLIKYKKFSIGWLPWGGYTGFHVPDIIMPAQLHRWLWLACGGILANVFVCILCIPFKNDAVVYRFALVNFIMALYAWLPLPGKDGYHLLTLINIKKGKWN